MSILALTRLLDEQADLTTISTWWPCIFRVRATGAETLRWVHQHLDCTLASAPAPVAPAAAEVSIVLSADSSALRQVGAAVARIRTRRVQGFPGQYWRRGVLEGLTVWYRAAEGATKDEAQAIVQIGPADWLAIASSGEAAALSGLRLARELLRTELACRPAVTVHAALVAGTDLGGLLLVGDAGVGKTTLALGLAQRRGYVVSTDQTVVVRGIAGRPVGLGAPHANRVGVGTVRTLTREIDEPHVALLRRDTRSFDGQPPTKAWVTPLETEVLYGIASAPLARVDAIVILGAGRDLVAIACPRSPGEGLPRGLAQQCRTADPLLGGFWLALPRDAHLDDPGPKGPAGLIAGLPTAELSWDPRHHAPDDALAALRRVLPARRSGEVAAHAAD